MTVEMVKKLGRDCALGARARVRMWAHDGRERARGRPTAHPVLELAWIESGKVSYRIGQRDFELRAGQAMVVPAAVEHTTTFEAPTRAGALWLAADLVQEVAEAIGRAREKVEPGLVSDPASAVQIGQVLARETLRAAPGQVFSALALAEAMAAIALRGAASRARHGSARDPRILAAIEKMHDAYAEPVAIDEIARAAGMTRFHFTRLFRSEVGEPPYRYLTRFRLARAAELLRCGRCGVTEAAFSVGLSDLGRFAQAFRREHGENPGDFARRVRVSRAVS